MPLQEALWRRKEAVHGGGPFFLIKTRRPRLSRGSIPQRPGCLCQSVPLRKQVRLRETITSTITSTKCLLWRFVLVLVLVIENPAPEYGRRYSPSFSLA